MHNFSKYIKTLTTICLLSFLFVSLGARFSFAEQINNFKVEAYINKDGTVDIKESIEYDFGTEAKHGIYRDIPYVLEDKTADKKYRVNFTDISVVDEQGNKYEFVQSEENGNLRLKIGNPDKTVTGVHLYNISYTARGGLRYNSDNFDELYFNATGNLWPVDIRRAEVHVYLPDNVDMINEPVDAVCFTGEIGSTETDCITKFNKADNSVQVTTNNFLTEREGLTVAVNFPKGRVDVLKPEEIVSFWDKPLGKVVLGLIFISAIAWYILLPIFIVYLWFKNGRDPDVGKAVSAWFDPPKTKSGRKLTPAESGALIDEQVHDRDIFAMIIGLAQKGYFKIKEETEKKFLGEKKEFYFVKQKDFDLDKDLQPFEKKFLNKVFTNLDNGKKIKITDIKMYDFIPDIKKSIYTKLVKNKFFPENPDNIRKKYTVLMVIGIVTGNLPLFLMTLIFGRAMPRKTLFGAEQANVAKGLRNFLSSQERELNYQGEKQLFFEKLLPYAVAFGVEDNWAKRFNDLQLKQPDWYETNSSNVFSTAYLMSSLHSSTRDMASVSNPPSSSSSSGFSGGFSGGGFGGGGGGSW